MKKLSLDTVLKIVIAIASAVLGAALTVAIRNMT